MKVALAAIALIGAIIGFAWPDGRTAPVAPPPLEAPSVDKPATRKAVASPQPVSQGWGGETRLRRGAGGHFLAAATVNGQPVEMVVDTGASIVALTEADARRIGIAYDPARFQVIGSGASGAVRGVSVTIDRLTVGGREVRALPAAVLEGLEVSLLGQSYLARIGGVSMTGDEMVLR